MATVIPFEFTQRLRPCMVKVDKDTEVKGLFHYLEQLSEVVYPSPLKGGHPGGQISRAFAVVEYEDGRMGRVEVDKIRFLDNIFSEYSFQDNHFKEK